MVVGSILSYSCIHSLILWQRWNPDSGLHMRQAATLPRSYGSSPSPSLLLILKQEQQCRPTAEDGLHEWWQFCLSYVLIAPTTEPNAQNFRSSPYIKSTADMAQWSHGPECGSVSFSAYRVTNLEQTDLLLTQKLSGLLLLPRDPGPI